MPDDSSTTQLTATPGQTVGPFFGDALPYEGGELLVPQAHPRAVRLHGVVTDGAGAVVPDALLEIWQADEQGNVPTADGSLVRDGYTFTGFGRAAVDNVGHYTFTTLNPGPTESGKAAFIALTLFGRGVTNRLFTRVYLPEDTRALAEDPLLASLPEDRRRTLIAEREADGSLRFDVRLQGEGETVFLAYPRHET
ncbi:protocatechuate 3,4-dioxygenase subunit alpha [Kocuria sp. CPCC 205300]|uniref:protocatechuate 3,4-dioxygenase subunit alpha n=1 Tax=Kocuria sabuli TaxID=3071448 RepID=UPI0036D8C870